jgi:glutamate carboxypeptidase
MSLIDRITEDLDRIVSAESPSKDYALLERCTGVIAEVGRKWLGAEPQLIDTDGVPNLLWKFGDHVEVLLLCHYDTVWPAGTIDRWPFSVDGDRATGPGIFDMKAGIVQSFAAVAPLQKRGGIAILVTGDEEVGSLRTRPLIEATARGAKAVLVLESSIDGALKTSRKGPSFWTATFTGRAAHAGLDPEKGASVITAISRWVPEVEKLNRSEAGTSVVVTMARAGTAMNVVPSVAEVMVDSRAATIVEQERVDREIRLIPSGVDGVTVDYEGGVNRLPLEERMSRELKARLDTVCERMGHPIIAGEPAGGASDGNITAALGIPTLDGFGAVGNHAHAEGEWASIPELADRAVLMTAFIADLLEND